MNKSEKEREAMTARAAIKKDYFISNHTAGLIAKMAEKFFAKPENVRGFNEWHKETYGHLPHEQPPGTGRKRKRG